MYIPAAKAGFLFIHIKRSTGLCDPGKKGSTAKYLIVYIHIFNKFAGGKRIVTTYQLSFIEVHGFVITE